MDQESKPQVFKRIQQNQIEIVSDTFFLTHSTMKEKVLLGRGKGKFEDKPHKHIFHTVDSSGKKLTTSNNVGGHFHVVELAITTKKDPKTGEDVTSFTAKCSGPKREKRVKNRKLVVPYDCDRDESDPDAKVVDNHTHEVEFGWTSIGKARHVNAESVKYIDQVMAAPAIDPELAKKIVATDKPRTKDME